MDLFLIQRSQVGLKTKTKKIDKERDYNGTFILKNRPLKQER